MIQNTIRDYSEKRDFIRMKLDTEIVLKIANSKPTTGICKDLSGTGMLIEVKEAIAEGSEIQTSLPSNNEAFPSLDTTVKVIRCKENENGTFLLGTEIVQVDN